MKRVYSLILVFGAFATTIGLVSWYCVCKNTNQDINVGQKVYTFAQQYDYYDGADLGTGVDGANAHEIVFSQEMKKIFVSNTTKIPLNAVAKNIIQETKPDKKNNSGYSTFQNFEYDTCQRNEDWANPYLSNAYIGIDKENNQHFGIVDGQFYLSNVDIWPINTNYRNIKVPIVYTKDIKNAPCTFANGEDLKLLTGQNRNFVNDSYHVRGIPYTFFKEDTHVYFVYNYVNRHLFTLQGGFPPSTDDFAKIKTDKSLQLDLFSLDNLFAIKKCDWAKKSVTIGISDDIINVCTSQNEKVINDSRHNLGYSNDDEPSSIIHDLLGKLNIKISYETGGEKHSLNFPFDSFNSSKTIFLNQINDQYDFKLLSASSKEYEDSSTYIQSTSTQTFANETENIDSDGILLKPQYSNLEWINIDGFTSENFVDSISDEECIKKFVKAYDTYGQVYQLTPDKYVVNRDYLNGEITISFEELGEQKQISGWKIPEKNISNISLKANNQNLNEKDLSDQQVIKSVLSFYDHDIDNYVIDNLRFSLEKINTGNVVIKVEEAFQNDLNIYVGQCFTINNTNTIAKNTNSSFKYLLIFCVIGVIFVTFCYVYKYCRKHFKFLFSRKATA